MRAELTRRLASVSVYNTDVTDSGTETSQSSVGCFLTGWKRWVMPKFLKTVCGGNTSTQIRSALLQSSRTAPWLLCQRWWVGTQLLTPAHHGRG